MLLISVLSAGSVSRIGGPMHFDVHDCFASSAWQAIERSFCTNRTLAEGEDVEFEVRESENGSQTNKVIRA